MQRKQPAEALRRGFIAFQASCFRGLYCSPFFPFSPAFSRNAELASPPPSTPMRITGMRSVCSRSATIAPTTAPIRAKVMTIDVTAMIMTSTVVAIRMTLPFNKCSLVTKGYFRPLTSHKRKLGSIIQLIVRNVKRIFMRGYILQIAVLIAVSGAFGDQIK